MSKGRPKQEVKMERITIRIMPDVWKQAKNRADRDLLNLSAVVRRLIELWLSGDINLDDFKDK